MSHIRTKHSSPERLVLSQVPKGPAVILGGLTLFWLVFGVSALRDNLVLGLVLLGATLIPLAMLSLVTRHTLVLDATDGSLTVARRSLFRAHRQVFELAELRRARTRYFGSGTRRRGLVQLDCGMSDPIAFGTRQPPKFAKAATKEINDWLDSHRAHA